MDEPQSKFELEVKKVLRICRQAEGLAIRTQEEAEAKYVAEVPMVPSAFYAIVHDSVCLFRSLVDSCSRGWSPAGAVVARTLLDLMISSAAIAKSENPELAAFRYLYMSFRNMTHDKSLPRSYRDEVRATCRRRISELAPEVRPEALRFLRRERRLAYWYANEFQRPTEILEKHSSPAVLTLYRSLSAAAHGGHLGLRLFRDDPDTLNLEPRRPGILALMVTAMGAMILAELTHFLASYERLPSSYLSKILIAQSDDLRSLFVKRITKAPDGRDIFDLGRDDDSPQDA